MLSKSQIRFINALHQKKARKEEGLFIAEGIKSVTEFLQSDYIVDTVFYIPDAAAKMAKFLRNIKAVEISREELKKISILTTPQDVLALIRIPEKVKINPADFKNTFTLVLDGIQDPGNFGTIIRSADWFGFPAVICSEDTVEAYNPKAVQAAMGSLSRMKVHYTNLPDFFKQSTLPVFQALLNGKSIYETDFGNEGFVVIGNEGNGISRSAQEIPHISVTIPAFGNAESLNAAIAASLFCYEIKRK